MDSNQDGSARPPNGSLLERQKNNSLWTHIINEVFKYNGHKKQLAEACAGIFKLFEDENSSLDIIFHHFIAAAVFKLKHKASYNLQKFGHVLAFSLLKEEESGRREIIKGIANFCALVEKWPSLSLAWGNISGSWDIVAEVLSTAILPTPGLFTGAPLTRDDFEGVFVEAAKDTENPNALKNKVNERLIDLSEGQKNSRIQDCIEREVLKYKNDKNKLDEACAGIIDIINSKDRDFDNDREVLRNPSYVLIFKNFMKIVHDLGLQGVLSMRQCGHVLAYCLQKNEIVRKGRYRILKGIAEFCGDVRNCSVSSVIVIVAEVLSYVILSPKDILGGALPTVEDYKVVFASAYKAHAIANIRDPYELFVQVLKRLTEMDKKGVKVDCEWIINNIFEDVIMDMDKFIVELKDTTTDFGYNLYDVLVESGSLVHFNSYGRTLEMLSSGDLTDEYRLQRLKMRIVREVYKYHVDKSKLDEACTEILNMHRGSRKVEVVWFKRPSLALHFQDFIGAAEEAQNSKHSEHILPAFGHVLARCLNKIDEKKENGRDEIINSIITLCGDVIEHSGEGRVASFCYVVGKVLSNAILPTPDLLTGTPLTVEDFTDAFFKTAEDSQKPYVLFAHVLKGLVEIRGNEYYKNKQTCKEKSFVARVNCESIIKKMYAKKLIEDFNDTPIFGSNLYEILRDCSCRHMTSLLYKHFYSS